MNPPESSVGPADARSCGHNAAARSRFHPHYLWLLPLSWSVVCWVSFQHPAGEYFFWMVGSLPGFWFMWIYGNAGDVNKILLPVIAVGAATMTVAGLLLAVLRVPVRWFLCGWLSLAIILFATELVLGDLKREHTPAEGVIAYALAAVNVGLWLNAVLMLLGVGGKRTVKKLFPRLHSFGHTATP